MIWLFLSVRLLDLYDEVLPEAEPRQFHDFVFIWPRFKQGSETDSLSRKAERIGTSFL